MKIQPIPKKLFHILKKTRQIKTKLLLLKKMVHKHTLRKKVDQKKNLKMTPIMKLAVRVIKVINHLIRVKDLLIRVIAILIKVIAILNKVTAIPIVKNHRPVKKNNLKVTVLAYHPHLPVQHQVVHNHLKSNIKRKKRNTKGLPII